MDKLCTNKGANCLSDITCILLVLELISSGTDRGVVAFINENEWWQNAMPMWWNGRT